MPWLLKSLGHQQAWYWLCRTDSMYCCSRVNFICLSKIQDTIQNVNTSYITFKTIQHINLCRTANMSWRTCVVVKQTQSNQFSILRVKSLYIIIAQYLAIHLLIYDLWHGAFPHDCHWQWHDLQSFTPQYAYSHFRQLAVLMHNFKFMFSIHC